jgi:predicted amidophosphoribosyltransferase
MRALQSADDWIQWLDQEHLAPSVAPLVDDACSLCHGSVGYQDDDEAFDRCYHCSHYADTLAALVPALYSVADGLESALHQYKDFGQQHRWLATPLSSILTEFLDEHLACIENLIGGVDVAVSVPSNNDGRGFDHIQEMLDSALEWPLDWRGDVIAKVREGRPGRGVMDPSFYRVVTDLAVMRNASVLLLDDTWTSGASLMSVAACLRDSGAERVVGLTIGRQLSPGFGSSDDLITTARARDFNRDVCVLCA